MDSPNQPCGDSEESSVGNDCLAESLKVLSLGNSWTAHLGERRMRQLREALSLLREITDPYA
jgi:hypothetical protein